MNRTAGTTTATTVASTGATTVASTEPTQVRLRVRALPPTDVAVVGGGMAGTFAALASARQGARTVLVEQHGFVGGQGTAGGVHTICGETRLVNDAWRDMLDRLRPLGGIVPYRPNSDGRHFDVEAMKFVLQELLREADVTLLLHTQLIDVERDGDAVRSLILHNKSGLRRLPTRMAVDASGDADVVARGCWPFEKGGPVFMPGDDPRLDAEVGDLQLPMSLYFTLVDTGAPVEPYLPPGAPTFEGDEGLPMITIHDHGHLRVVKMKVIGHDATDGASLSEAEQDGRRQMLGVIYHLQTQGYRGLTYPTFKLAWVAPHIGVREGRRTVAQLRIASDDVLEGRHFEDAVAVGSYHVDYHWPTVVQRAGTGLTTQNPPYQVPLRALRPRGSSNLLVAGRSVCGEQMAMSSYRVMGTCAQTGFAAGTAAAVAVRHQASLDATPITAIQASLRRAGVRLDLAPYTNYLRSRRSVDEPVFRSAPGFRECHASTLALLPNGDVVCAWFGGTTEGADDVAIWLAVRHEERWSEPREVARHEGEPTWNPVLFLPDSARLFSDGARLPAEGRVEETDDPPRLLLYYRAGKTIRAWRSYVMESADGGRTWSAAQPLPAGILGPIRNKPIVLSDGSWLAGSSVETDDAWYCTVERSEDQGRTWTVAAELRLEGHPKGIIQPTIWEGRPGEVHALMRSRGVGRIVRADSTDGGRTWCAPYLTDLPNNNSGIDVTPLVPAPGDPGHDGGYPPLALAHNPVETGRTPLVISVSYDNGHTWPDRMLVRDVAAGAHAEQPRELALSDDGMTRVTLPGEYSYPAIVPTADGVALSYTFDRRHVQFARYSLERLRGSAPAEVAPGVGHHEGTAWVKQLADAARRSGR